MKKEALKKFHENIFFYSPEWKWAIVLGPGQNFAWLVSVDEPPNLIRRLIFTYILGLIVIQRDKSLDPEPIAVMNVQDIVDEVLNNIEKPLTDNLH